MALDLARQRCFNHARREAAARCPECGRCFCRECVTEHQYRMVCSACLARLARDQGSLRRRVAGLVRFAQLTLGLLAAWLFFFLLGQGLLALPSSFHHGTVWKQHEVRAP